MGEWLVSLEGTDQGRQLATLLVLTAALAHAAFGALQKGKHDPWVARGSIDLWFTLVSAPVALFVVPWPEGAMWGVLAGAMVIHFIYKVTMALAYEYAAYTVVYPVVRGTSPLFTVVGAYLLFSEIFTPVQWLGVAVLLSGIFGLAVYNLRYLEVNRENLPSALMLAVATGLFVALYTTYDAYGIRAAADPFTFLAWFFMLDGVVLPIYAFLRWRAMPARPAPGPLFLRGIVGGVVAFFSFGSILMATRLDKVGEAAVLRETSTVFAALIGWLVLKETVGPRRIALMTLIAAGAVIVEMGG